MSINKAIVVRNIGRDPEIRALPSGQSVASFSIATTAGDSRIATANPQEPNGIAWGSFGRLADNCQGLLFKGRQVYIEGRFNTRQYQAKDGTDPRFRTGNRRSAAPLARQPDQRNRCATSRRIRRNPILIIELNEGELRKKRSSSLPLAH
jgi:single-stranded DNA-binding protein